MSELTQQAGYEFNILAEDVSAEDLFEDKTHEKVSESLYQVINKSDKGITIGLEGSWGAGKSTVINIFKEKLKKTDHKTVFFMFDAWAHDGDPLRRIFLESLICKLDPNEDDEDLSEIKSQITGRKKSVEVNAKKSTSRLGKYLSISALLIPIGSAFLGKTKFESLVWPWSELAGSPSLLLIFGLLFCFAPFLVLLYWCFCGDKEPISGKVSWEFFSVDSRESYTQDITEDGERTSIEFEKYFKAITQTVIKKQHIDKFVIVIDNLDRVPPACAKNIWSTLQTFFQKRSGNDAENEWSDKVWFVIPFDRDGFKKIWDAEQNNDVAPSFLKKCFQLIADVPQPVMSGWINYVEKCVSKALPKWPEQKRNEVVSTYIRYASRLDKSPTPRDIKIFTNQVGLLGSMWGDNFSPEAMSLYVLLKESIKSDEIRQKLIQREMHQDYKTENDPTMIFSELSGLLFGVSRDKGVQLLLGPEISSAFKSGNGEQLSNLAHEHGGAFWVAYEATKDKRSITLDTPDEQKIKFTLAICNGLKDFNNKIKQDVVALSNIWLTAFDKLKFEEYDFSASFALIYDLLMNREQFIDSLRNLVKQKLQNTIASVDNNNFPVNSLENFKKTIDFLSQRGKPLERLLYGKLDGDNWPIWLKYIEEKAVTFETVLPAKKAILNLADKVQFTSPSIDKNHLDVLIKTYEIYPDSSEWIQVSEMIASWFNIPNRMHDCDEVYNLAIKLMLDNKTGSSISDCIESQSFWRASQHTNCLENLSLPILAALVFEDEIQSNNIASSNVKSFWAGSVDIADNARSELFNLIKEIDRLDLVWILAKDSNNSTAIDIIKSSNDDSLYGSWAGVCFIDEYDWATESEAASLAKKLAINGAFDKHIEDMKGEPKKYQHVYEIFYKLGFPQVIKYIDSEVRAITQKQWMDLIANNSFLVSIVKDKNPHFSDALTDVLINKVSMDSKGETIQNDFSAIPVLLGKTTDLNVSVIPKIINAYFSSPIDSLSDFEFEILSSFFSPHMRNVDEIDLMERINVWIDQGSKKKIEWLMSQDVSILREPLEGLISRVKLWLNSSDRLKIEIVSMVNTKFNLGVITENENFEDVELANEVTNA